VHRGEVLAQIDPRPFQIQLQQAEGALARDQAQLLAAQQDLKRYDDLAARKLVAAQQADDQKALVGQGEGLVRVDQAQVASARLNLDYARITAPIDGVTGIRLVDPGNVVRAADPTGIVVLTQLDPIAVIFTLPQDVLSQVAEQSARGKLQVQVFSRDGLTELGRGTLEVIDNAINASTSTLRLKAVLGNPKHALWPNQFVKTRLLLASRKDALVVPAPVVQRGPEGTFAYVVGEGGVVQPRPMLVERQLGDEVVVAKGLEAGEVVVLEGQNLLRTGSKVAPREQGQKAPPREGAARASGAPEQAPRQGREQARP
jgi:multidrug efflux system membrane fusion protein